MLAKETDKAFDSKDWIYEIKWDGYRAIAEVKNKVVKLYSRNGNSLNDSYPLIVEALANMNIHATLDGEIVVTDENGQPSFQLLQNYHKDQRLVYYVFDLLKLHQKNYCKLPLLERKKQLKKLLKKSIVVNYSDHVREKGIDFFKLAIKQNLEGIMAKKADSVYLPGTRTSDWLKIKHHKTREAIIAGYTAPKGSRKHFGSLVLAEKKGRALKYIGQTGGGFNAKSLKAIYDLLKSLRVKQSPFLSPISINVPFTPVKPVLVCEVQYTEVTQDGKLRHPIFIRLREDKTAKEVNEDAPNITKHVVKNKVNKLNPTPEKKQVTEKAPENELAFGKIKVKISNRKKLFWPSENITKGDVIDYYQSMSAFILPYLIGRPESLKRNPNGILQGDFFQKDAALEAPLWVERQKIFSESAHKQVNYILCNNVPTLLYLANLGCIEFNPWHSTIEALDKPDYMVIDLDPSVKNTFGDVIETALTFKMLFDKMGIKSYCKTSGATGMHIYVPMQKQYTYDQVKDFAHLICMTAHNHLPNLTSLERSLTKRNNKHIYLDYLQNRKGQTIASAYCLRPEPGAPVSMPLHWKEVKKGLSPHDFHIHNALNRVKKTGDLFAGILGKGIDMQKCLGKLDR